MALTNAQQHLLDAAREAGKELGWRGQALSSLIGELAACEKADLVWEPSDGYDARSGQLRVQIKTRKSWSTPEVNPAGRLGRFGRKKGYLFDIGLYIALNDEFNIVGIWYMSIERIKALEGAEPGSRGLHVSKFVKNADPISVS